MAKKSPTPSIENPISALSLSASIEELLAAIPANTKAYTPKLSDDKMKILVRLTEEGRSAESLYRAFPELQETYKSYKGLAHAIAFFKRGGSPMRGRALGPRNRVTTEHPQ